MMMTISYVIPCYAPFDLSPLTIMPSAIQEFLQGSRIYISLWLLVRDLFTVNLDETSHHPPPAGHTVKKGGLLLTDENYN